MSYLKDWFAGRDEPVYMGLGDSEKKKLYREGHDFGMLKGAIVGAASVVVVSMTISTICSSSK